MPSIIKKLPANIHGKDYVIGDLHGCLDLLERLLQKVNFNAQHDRLFSVGDLIDRGPYPLSCLQLLHKPWFFAVKGNHEAMLLDCFTEYLPTNTLPNTTDFEDSDFIYNGGEWIYKWINIENQFIATELKDALSAVFKLPLIYIVGTGESRFHVIHAELTKPNPFNHDEMVWLDSDIDQWYAENSITTEVEQRLLWSRSLMRFDATGDYPAKVQKGLSTTFCGHSITKTPKQFLSHVCLDTGAFMSMNGNTDFGLSLYDVKESQCLSTAYHQEDVNVTTLLTSTPQVLRSDKR